MQPLNTSTYLMLPHSQHLIAEPKIKHGCPYPHLNRRLRVRRVKQLASGHPELGAYYLALSVSSRIPPSLDICSQASIQWVALKDSHPLIPCLASFTTHHRDHHDTNMTRVGQPPGTDGTRTK